MQPQKRSGIYQVMIALFITVVALGSLGRISQGQSSNWSTPKQLSSPDITAWFPDVAADVYGNIHVVWASGYPGFDSVFYTTSDNGLTWKTPLDIFSLPQGVNESASTRPTLLLDRQSNLNISFVDLTKVYFSKVQLWNADSALNWSPRLVLSGDQIPYFSKMAIDSKNTLHYVFTQNVPSGACPVCYHIFYRQSTDGGLNWSDPLDIIKRQIGAVKPQLLIDKQDNIHLVWESGQGGGVGQLSNPTAVTYAVSYDGGKTWSSPTDFPLNDKEMGKNITIGLDRYDHLVVAYWSLPADSIMYQTSSDDGRSWSDPVSIPDVWGAAEIYPSNLDDYAMASDSLGNLHLVAVGRVLKDQKELDIVDLVWNGITWAKPDVITSYKGDVPEWPRIAINKGNQLNVVWFVRDEAHIWESAKGQYRIFYSKGFASAPSVPAEILPTVTPTLAATEVVEMTPTTEVLPGETAVPVEPTLSLSDQIPPPDVPITETDYLPLLAKALFPSLLFVAGIVVFAFIRRR